MLREDNLFFKRSILVFKETADELLKKKRNQEKQDLYLIIKPILNKMLICQARKTAVFIIN